MQPFTNRQLAVHFLLVSAGCILGYFLLRGALLVLLLANPLAHIRSVGALAAAIAVLSLAVLLWHMLLGPAFDFSPFPRAWFFYIWLLFMAVFGVVAYRSRSRNSRVDNA